MIRSVEGMFERSPTALYDTYITSEDARMVRRDVYAAQSHC